MSTTSSSTDLLGSGVVACSSLMDRDQTVTAGRRVDEGRPQARLELVEPAAEREQRRVNRRVGGVAAEQAGVDEVARRRGLRALGQEEYERRLLLGEPGVALAEPDRPPRRVELEAAEPVAAGPAGAALDQPGGEVA